MNQPRKVAVIGLGMIGGSVARGLSARGLEVLGYDTNQSHLDAAISEGVVSRALRADLEDVGDADAVVIAVYGDHAVAMLERIAPHAGNVRLVTDVGSTKRTIVSAAGSSKLCKKFVGSHPFAGDHRSGWHASRADLFEGQTVYLCPTDNSDEETIALASSLWVMLGADTVSMDAAEHDRLVAWTSHLPHLVSTTLALALAEAGIGRHQLGRGGNDVTRLASGSPDVWTAIALDNAGDIELAIDGMEQQLKLIKAILRDSDRDTLKDQLAKAQSWSRS